MSIFDTRDRYTALAGELSQQHGIFQGQGQSDQNAFFHAFVSAGLSYNHGTAPAGIAGSLREWTTTGDSPADTARDHFNNAIGIQVGFLAAINGVPETAIPAMILDAYSRGHLMVNEFSDPRVGTQGEYSGISEVTNRHLQETYGSALPSDLIEDGYGPGTPVFWLNLLNLDYIPVPQNRPEFCFLAGTMIDMWPLDVPPDAGRICDEKELLAKVWKKPIEEITPEDWVVSYDDKGRLKPGRVTQTFQNHSKHILDVHGLMVTPGHATYCAKVEGEDNKFADGHVPIIDILRSDGALMKADGTLVRAATDCVVGSKDDEQFWAFLLYEDKDGAERVREKCQLRLGTRWMMPNGNHFSMREYMNGIGVELIEEGPQKGYMRFKETGVVTVFAWTLSESLPKPEDYVLQRSQVTLEEIYEADEWEAVRPQIPAPFMGESGRSNNRDTASNTDLYAGSTSTDHLPPNNPQPMRNSPNQPTMSRKQRRAMEAKQRKGGKQPKRAQTIH